MTRRRRAIFITLLSVSIAVLGTLGWIGYRIHFTLSHLHEAYAAWDTGALLVGYMEANNDRWPSSWPDLLTVLDPKSGQQVAYINSLRNLVAIDWRFDPSHPSGGRPVSRPDGTSFPVQWEDPNDMVRDYLRQRATTQQSEAR
jgi:hypothetical protein